MNRTLLVAALAILLVLPVAQQASAYQTWHDRKLTYGVHNQHFWLSAEAESNFHNAIFDGVGLWNATTDTQVYYTNTATQSVSRLDFVKNSTSSYSYCATTRHYVDTTIVDADSGDGHGLEPQSTWWWAKVTIDTFLFKNTSACSSVARRKTVIAHEQGHAMGLAHAVNSGRLMYTDYLNTSVTEPMLDDRNGINALY